MNAIYKAPTFHFIQGWLVEMLTGYRTGRIALHVLCLLRQPSRLRWHWRGIARELRLFGPVSIFLILTCLARPGSNALSRLRLLPGRRSANGLPDTWDDASRK